MEADPRQADVYGVEGLLEQVADRGPVYPAVLPGAALCVLGAMERSLIDADVWSWWTKKSAADRAARASEVMRWLAEREMLGSPQPGADHDLPPDAALPVRPRLGVVLAGRTRPAWIAIRREGTSGAPDALRMYGIADQMHGLRAVLLESVSSETFAAVGGTYAYALFSPMEAAKSLALWVASPAQRTGLMRRQPPKVIDIYLPGAGLRQPADRIEVHPNDDGLWVERQTYREPAAQRLACDEDALARLLAGVLAGACR